MWYKETTRRYPYQNTAVYVRVGVSTFGGETSSLNESFAHDYCHDANKDNEKLPRRRTAPRDFRHLDSPMMTHAEMATVVEVE
jgi:hypothetical protein